uniref:MARTX n=1 Tax=Ganoderma boninense TaxID=34458 RepID=A0A5K1K5L7_9APHY|nr:MARTX [Ganoderma boninense]
MTPLSVLLALTTAAVTVSAKAVTVRDSPVTLSIARRFNSTGATNIVKADQARAKVLKARSQATRVAAADTPVGRMFPGHNVPVTNQVVIYTASVGVGSPPTSYELLVDTGSANTWVGANQPYVKTSSSVDTGAGVSIGVADIVAGFNGLQFDGILGIGPVGLTQDTTSAGGEVPTVVDSAFAQGLIHAKVVGVSFEPTTQDSVTNGELTFGGVDHRKFFGQIQYVPITSTSPASEYVGIDQSITYGSSKTTILSLTAGITDTGTTLVLLASDAFAAYQNATGGVLDSNTGLLRITAEQFAKLESLFFHIGDATYEFTPNAQIWPRALNAAIGGDADSIYLVTADLNSPSGEGFDFVDGYTFLERFYYVYDSAHSSVGFAKTPFTYAKTN